MAPHALTDLNDTSGYYPLTGNKSWSQTITYNRYSQNHLANAVPSAKPPFSHLGFGSKSPKNVWNLSSDEVDEIEKNVRCFTSMHQAFTK